MKKLFYAVFGLAALFTSCTSPVNVNEGKVNTPSVYVEGKGNVSNIFSFYDFTQENPGCEINGFCGNEDFGRWTNADTAIIDLNTAPMAEFTVKLNIDRVITPETEPLVFDVQVNGEKIAHEATNGGIIYINVPKEKVGADGFARLLFLFENAAKPSKYNPQNTDPRKLGFGLRNVTVYGYSVRN